jgi:hypothetical protein
MKQANLSDIQRLLLEAADLIDREQLDEDLVERINDLLNHLNNSYCVLYYP